MPTLGKLTALVTALLAAAAPTAQSAPQERAPAQSAVIGDIVPDLPFVDIRSLDRSLSDFGRRDAIVLVFVTCDCPMVGRVLPAFGRLATDFADRDVQFVAVNVGRGDSIRDMGTQAIELDQRYPFVKDETFAMVRTLGIERTTTCVVLDRERRLRYRGRIDDQVLYSKVREAPTRADLRLALEAVLGGGAVEIPETRAAGCLLSAPSDPAPTGGYTFHRDIQPLLQKHCQDCHHEGGAGPFPLLTIDDVLDNAEMIAEVVDRQRMPPWQASDAHGEFRNRRGLTRDETRVLRDWLASGTPVGDAADAPTPRTFAPGPWRIGEPDQVLELVAPVRLPADGVVPYRYFAFPFRFREDTWVEAIEILPENRRVLHHANLAWVDPAAGFDQDGFMTGYVPGGDPMVLDPGTAMRIPAGSVLAIQAHYVTTGRPETDHLRVGLRFPRTAVTRQAEVLIVTNTRFAIPPGAEAHRVTARRRVADDSTVIGLFAHMHLRGRDMTFVAQRPAADPDTLLMIPNYDFDWQASYRCPDGAVRLPKDTVVEVFAHFDNSAFNPYNPDPADTVRFGQQTFEEMMYGFVFLTRDTVHLDLRIDPATGSVVAD
ncbi:MAG: redoxin family protein [Planctomycetes bacterium]|nr:redoxin family protein [Planctomycetota bacterium]